MLEQAGFVDVQVAGGWYRLVALGGAPHARAYQVYGYPFLARAPRSGSPRGRWCRPGRRTASARSRRTPRRRSPGPSPRPARPGRVSRGGTCQEFGLGLAGVAISLSLLGVGAVWFGPATNKTTDRPPDPTTGCVWFLGARSRHRGRRRGGRRVRDGAHPGTKPAAQRHQPAGSGDGGDGLAGQAPLVTCSTSSSSSSSVPRSWARATSTLGRCAAATSRSCA